MGESKTDWRETLERIVAAEWPEGRSAGAAARELCRTLGAAGISPTLQRLLNELLGQANFAAHDRTLILQDFAEASPEAARIAKLESFERWNPHITSGDHNSEPSR